MKYILLLMSNLILSGCLYTDDDVYEIGEEIKLSLIENTAVYIDEKERLWALIENRNEEIVPVPAGFNRCLLEEAFFPTVEGEFNVRNYVFYNNICHLKMSPVKSITFDYEELAKRQASI
jgi:hypothetical protein